jgi:hypothetical protein
MYDATKNRWILKLGVGGTPMVSTVTYNDWNASHTELYDKLRILVLNGLIEMEHVYRKTPVIRSLVSFHGETDAITTGAGSVYKANYTTMVNTLIDAIHPTYPINKMRLYVFRISDAGGYAYDVTEFPLVKSALQDIGTNYLTDNPTYNTKVLGTTWRTTDDATFLDPQHVDAAGLDMLGKELFYYLYQHHLE